MRVGVAAIFRVFRESIHIYKLNINLLSDALCM